MKAIVYTQYGLPEVLVLNEIEKPIPKDNEVLIRIKAAAVSSADSAIRKGEQLMVRLAFGLMRPKKTVLGTEFAGVIETVGQSVIQFKPGDQVFAASGVDFGAHAEYICLPEDGALAPKPANVSYSDAAAICEGGLTALPFLRDEGRLQSGQKVLINGASGSVGVSAVQLAKLMGAEVTGVCSTANLGLLKSLGADHVIDYTTDDFTESGQTYDVIFDAVGKRSFSQCRGVLTKNGVYLTTVLTWSNFFYSLLRAKSRGKKARVAFTGLRSDLEKMNDLITLKKFAESGKITSVIGECYPIEQMIDAYRIVDTGHKKGNVIITL